MHLIYININIYIILALIFIFAIIIYIYTYVYIYTYASTCHTSKSNLNDPFSAIKKRALVDTGISN